MQHCLTTGAIVVARLLFIVVSHARTHNETAAAARCSLDMCTLEKEHRARRRPTKREGKGSLDRSFARAMQTNKHRQQCFDTSHTLTRASDQKWKVISQRQREISHHQESNVGDSAVWSHCWLRSCGKRHNFASKRFSVSSVWLIYIDICANPH